MTVDAVKTGTKTVTRRHVDTWQTLKAGDRLTLVEKGMGLAKGEKQVVLAEVEIVDVRVERLWVNLTPAEMEREGFDPWERTPHDWCDWWATTHGYRPDVPVRDIECRRIEWRYLDGEVA
jgi:hypothetical protein